jgi:hypothetical protein
MSDGYPMKIHCCPEKKRFYITYYLLSHTLTHIMKIKMKMKISNRQMTWKLIPNYLVP